MGTKKLDKEDFDSIKTLRTKYAENSNNIGLITVDEYTITAQLNEINKTKDHLFSEFETLKQEETTLLNKLKEKYGDGQIDIETGTFTPES